VKAIRFCVKALLLSLSKQDITKLRTQNQTLLKLDCIQDIQIRRMSIDRNYSEWNNT